MEPLVGFWSYFWMLTAAAVAGAIGGFAFELMPAHSQCHMGSIRTPHGLRGNHSFNLGFLSNLLLGAVTAVAVLYFFPPETQTIVREANGLPQTNYSYDLVKLLALSLIVGSAGPSFLSSIQGRLAGALNQQRQTDVNMAQDRIDKLAETILSALEEHHDDAKRQVNGLLDPLPTTLKEVVNKAPMVVAENGNHNGESVLAHDQAVNDVDKIVDSTVNKLHDICDTTVAGLKQQLRAQAETAKQDIRQEMGST